MIAVAFLANLATDLARITPGAGAERLRRGRVDAGAASVSALSAAPRAPSTVQPLDPALRWNWPSVGPGQISMQQFCFCDTQPASATEPTFVPGTGSFSDAYRLFLELVDVSRFIPADSLISARAAAAVPRTTPSAGVGPPGWVTVPDGAGILEFRPDWEVTMLPGEWSIERSEAFSCGAAASSGFLRGTRLADALDARTSDALMRAADVARVPVYPGAWYSDGLVRLAALGPFLGDRDPREIVGPGGILICRITEFYVAAGISASLTLGDADARSLVAHLAADPSARIGPLAAQDAVIRATATSGGTCVTAATNHEPYIVAVSVQPVGRPADG